MAKARTDYSRAELREITPKEKLFAIAKRMGAHVTKSKPRDEIEKAIIRRQRQLKKQEERSAEREAVEPGEGAEGAIAAAAATMEAAQAELEAGKEEALAAAGAPTADTIFDEGDDDEPDDMIDDDDDLDDGLDDERDLAPTMAEATTVSAPREARMAKLREAQARKEAGGTPLLGHGRGPAASRPATSVRSPRPRRRTPG